MAWVSRNLKNHLVPTPLSWTGMPLCRSGCPGPIQLDLKHLEGWDIQNFFRQPVPMPHHSLSEEFPPNIKHKSPVF